MEHAWGIAVADLFGFDLLNLIGMDTQLRKVATTNGGEWAGPCPFCGGRDRFRVWPTPREGKARYWCRQCEAKGDAISYVMRRDRLSFPEAMRRLGTAECRRTTDMALAPHSTLRPLGPPGPAWQRAGRLFLVGCQEALWAKVGAKALDWLRRRRLSEDIIKAAGLGFNPSDRYQDVRAWGLDGKAVWLPQGVVIPWMIGGKLWRLNIRRLLTEQEIERGEKKYIGPAGFSQGLYNADALTSGRPVVMCEGEINALTVSQHAGDLVTAVATGTTTGARKIPWVARLASTPLVLVAFDADENRAGDKAAAWWLGVLPNGRRWRPYWDDANQMAQDGADVRAWVEAGLATYGNVAPMPDIPVGQSTTGEGMFDTHTIAHMAAPEAADQSMPMLSLAVPGAGSMPPEQPCFACRGQAWWQRPDGDWVCGVCHPPLNLESGGTRGGQDAAGTYPA
jgi:hypothetical protein